MYASTSCSNTNNLNDGGPIVFSSLNKDHLSILKLNRVGSDDRWHLTPRGFVVNLLFYSHFQRLPITEIIDPGTKPGSMIHMHILAKSCSHVRYNLKPE